VVPLLGPIDAIAHEWSFPRWHFDADAGKEVSPGVGQLVPDVVAGLARRVMAVAARVVAAVAANECFSIADLWTGQPVVAVTAVGFDGQQARGSQLAEVAAGCRAADTCFVSQDAGRRAPTLRLQCRTLRHRQRRIRQR
jgi:hypothetical protein